MTTRNVNAVSKCKTFNVFAVGRRVSRDVIARGLLSARANTMSAFARAERIMLSGCSAAEDCPNEFVNQNANVSGKVT